MQISTGTLQGALFANSSQIKTLALKIHNYYSFGLSVGSEENNNLNLMINNQKKPKFLYRATRVCLGYTK